MPHHAADSRSKRFALGTLLFVLLVIPLLLSACELSQEDIEALSGLAEGVLNEQLTQQASGGTDSEQAVATEATPVPTLGPAGSSDGLWTVFFTNPVIPFDDVTTGGVDQYAVLLIDSAESTIDIAAFEFDLASVTEALLAAHARGVRVRVVYDDEHTEEDPNIEELLDAGIPGTPDERSAFMHNKFMVVDSEFVWTGSTNFTENGNYRNNNNSIVFASPELAANYTVEFEEMFNGEFGPTSTANTPNPGVAIGDIWVESYFAPEDTPDQWLIEAVSEAQSSIRVMIFSFTLDPLYEAIAERGAAGVDVRGIFETRGANTQYSECPRLLADGFQVRMDSNPRTFHHKVLIIDERIVATGSFNFSANATESNDENLLIIHSPEIAAEYMAEFDRQWEQALAPDGNECLQPDD